MFAVLAVTFPFFALVLCGWLAARLRVVPLSAIAGLNTFVLYFALPCLLYRFGAGTPLAQLLDPVAAGVYFGVALVLVAATVALTRRRWGWSDASFAALVTAFPNSGFMGVPLLVALVGPHSAGPVILTIAVDMCLTSSLCVALSRLGVGGMQGMAAALRQALRGVAANPLPISIALGAMASAWGWRLWAPLERSVAMLADAASPVALFTIGAVLARSQLDRHEAVAPREYLPLALVKLLVHPALVWAGGWLAMRLGLALAPATLVVLVLVAALPSASNVAMLVERFGAHTGRVAHIILVSTALAFLSFSALVAWLV
ncbi:AEC family transporter [Comamonas flocculans]|uniref:AEC family transporter n=1 Tax=Comamonas flocculans TaxID=2597701 RepID=A0A5B8RV78_9BURK|nr:AEC family transporter [Comamonas flocculans]QEA12652.1 AEC family transporter [Comamonas flocculans]